MLVFQKRLKETRKDRELTQEELGKAIYVSKQEVCLYESGKRTITISHLITLAKYYNVSIDYLVGLSNFKDENNKTNKLA